MSINSNYQAGLYIDSALRTSQVYLALFTSDPNPDASGTECSYNGYARKSMGAVPASAWAAVDGSRKTRNLNTIMFDKKNDAGSVTITHFAIFTAATGGNMRFFGPLDTPKTVAQDDVIGLLANNLEFQF